MFTHEPPLTRHKTFVILFLLALIANLVYFKSASPSETRSKIENTSIIRNRSDHVTSERCGNTTADCLQKAKVVKVFLFAYMRGGSSIAGELFNCDPLATMWYEPGDAFFSAYYGLCHENLPQHDLYFANMTRRRLNDGELQAMTQFYNDIFDCNYERLPAEAMGHYFLKESTAMDDYMECMRTKRTKGININACKSPIKGVCSAGLVEKSITAQCDIAIATVKAMMEKYVEVRKHSDMVLLLENILSKQDIHLASSDYKSLLGFVRHGVCVETMARDNAKCLDKAKARCQKDKIRVVQVNRMKMEDLEPLIQDNPDLYVLHYTRDPRAIALSRHNTRILTFKRGNNSLVPEAEFICRRMREDLRQRQRLEAKYPGVIRHFTYEQLASNGRQTAKQIYALFNRRYPKKWDAFLTEHMHGKKGEGAGFGITVKNATVTIMKWKWKIPKEQLDVINGFCADVIKALGYQV